MTTYIKIVGLDDADRELKELGQIPPQAVRALAQYIFDKARAGAGKHGKTGALEQSTYLRKLGDGWEVGHDKQRAPHAAFVHWGTRPHIIKRRQRRALRWPHNGRFIFAQSVKHPGYKGDPWLIKALDTALMNFENIVAASLKGKQS